jgi:hypothetical protein
MTASSPEVYRTLEIDMKQRGHVSLAAHGLEEFIGERMYEERAKSLSQSNSDRHRKWYNRTLTWTIDCISHKQNNRAHLHG